MIPSYLAYIVLMPFVLGVAFMIWVLWNLTLELRPRKSITNGQRVIPIQTFAYRFRHERDARILRLDIRP